MNEEVNIVIWNANGLAQRSLELKTYIRTNNVDIMLISETHFTQKNFMKIPQYSIYSTNHPDGKAHGGTAIIIKNSIKHYENKSVSYDYIQSTNVTIIDNNGPFTLSAIYCPPKFTIDKEKYKKFFDTLGNRYLAGGDYNAKHPWWGSRSSTPNPKGRNLYSIIKSENLTTISTGEPTYWPSDIKKLPDLIDFAIIKGICPNRFSAKSSFDLSSDHSPIIINYKSKIEINMKHCAVYNSKTNWDTYKNILNDKITCDIPLKSPQDVDNAIHELTENIQTAAKMATPNYALNPKIKNFTSKAILDKLKEKRNLRKIWQKSRLNSDKTRYNRSIKDLKKSILEDRNAGIQTYLENLTPTEKTDYSLWKATKKIKRPQQFSPPILKINKTWARTDSEKANVFADHLENVFTPSVRTIPKEEETSMLNNSQLEDCEDYPLKAVKIKEINHIIKNLKNRKSPGIDNVNGKLLKELPPKAKRFITIIMNAIIRLSYFPSQWKIAKIILIAKPGKAPELVTSYRPISLLPTLSKVCEKIILKRLNKVLTTKNIIPEHQFGFRVNHSTIEQINRVTTKIRNTFEKNEYCNAIFLDVAQAFDKVWHEGLLLKLRRILPKNLYTLLKSYLTNRLFKVKVNNETTKLHAIRAGIPQGSVLGPILYLIYTHDLPTRQEITIATYADDTVILTSHLSAERASQNLQKYLDVVQLWFKKWRITINETKSIQVTYTLKKGDCPGIYLNNQQIPQGQIAKYLGMHLDRRLTWRKHIWTKRKQLNLKMKQFYWLIGRKSKLSLKNKLLIYKSIIKPTWTYGIQLWGTASNSNIEIIERFQNKTLRTIINAPWFIPNSLIRKEIGIPTVKEEIEAYSRKYKSRISNHSNRLAKDLLQITPRTSRFKKYKSPFFIVK